MYYIPLCSIKTLNTLCSYWVNILITFWTALVFQTCQSLEFPSFTPEGDRHMYLLNLGVYARHPWNYYSVLLQSGGPLRFFVLVMWRFSSYWSLASMQQQTRMEAGRPWTDVRGANFDMVTAFPITVPIHGFQSVSCPGPLHLTTVDPCPTT